MEQELEEQLRVIGEESKATGILPSTRELDYNHAQEMATLMDQHKSGLDSLEESLTNERSRKLNAMKARTKARREHKLKQIEKSGDGVHKQALERRKALATKLREL